MLDQQGRGHFFGEGSEKKKDCTGKWKKDNSLNGQSALKWDCWKNVNCPEVETYRELWG